jgi:hypothetical protein
MHTIIVILGGHLLLGMFLLTGRAIAGSAKPVLARLALGFIPLWLACAAFNLWVGVSRAGYSVGEELPIFLVVFAVPAAVAFLQWRRYSRG